MMDKPNVTGSSGLPQARAESDRLVDLLNTNNRDTLNAVTASFLGWALDAFDFFVLVFVLTKAAKEFDVSLDKMTLSITATLALRPLGALLFGSLADRYGRRVPMMWNLAFFSLMEVLSGLAPTFSSFMVCRCLFGVGMGGEWGLGAALSMEKVPPRLRGIVSGFLQQGYPFGYLLAACCFRWIPAQWSWRSLFFIGAVPTVLAVYFLYRVKESAVWQSTRQQSWASLGRAILKNWKLFLYLTLLMTLMNFASHGTQDLYPTFLEKERHLTKTQVADIAIIYNIGAILGGVAFGFLSDRLGRRRAMACGSQHGHARPGSVLHAIHGAGQLGRDSRSHYRTCAGCGARVPSGFCLPMRSPFRRQFRAFSESGGSTERLLRNLGHDGAGGFRCRRPGDPAWPGAPGGAIRRQFNLGYGPLNSFVPTGSNRPPLCPSSRNEKPARLSNRSWR
jgi:SHS family lactate transporter-like MFS transporter